MSDPCRFRTGCTEPLNCWRGDYGCVGEPSATHPTEPQGETPLADKVTKLPAATPFERDARYALAVGFLAGVERALSECRRELERKLQEREDEVWNEVVEVCCKAWPNKKVFYNSSPIELIVQLINERDESRLASHAESAGAEQEPCAWRYRYGKTGMWKYADRAEDTNQGEEYEREPLYPMPWQNQAPSPAPDSQADGLELEAWARQVCEGTNMSWPYLAEQVSLRSRQAPRGEAAELAKRFYGYAESAQKGAAGDDPKWAEGRATAYRRCARDCEELAHPQSGEDDTQIRKLMEGK